MAREEGYYWVRKYGRWMPAEWVLTNKRCYWNIMGLEYFFDDSEFEEIDENRIIRDDNNRNA